MEGSDCSVCSAASCAAPCCSSRFRSWPRPRSPAAPRRSTSPRTARTYDGAEIFHERCAGCHTLDVVGAQGSAVDANNRERKDGPNFNERKEDVDAGPLRDPQRRLLLRRDAAEHRGRQGGRGGRASSSPSTRASRRRQTPAAPLALRPAVLDLKAIRRDPDAVRAALARRGDGSDARLDEVLALDERRRELLPEVEGLRARQNEASQAHRRGEAGGRGRRRARSPRCRRSRAGSRR